MKTLAILLFSVAASAGIVMVVYAYIAVFFGYAALVGVIFSLFHLGGLLQKPSTER